MGHPVPFLDKFLGWLFLYIAFFVADIRIQLKFSLVAAGVVFRTLSAVYEVIGEQSGAEQKLKAEELFRKLDENSDGEISQVRKHFTISCYIKFLVFLTEMI